MSDLAEEWSPESLQPPSQLTHQAPGISGQDSHPQPIVAQDSGGKSRPGIESFLRKVTEALQAPKGERSARVSKVVIDGLRETGRFYHSKDSAEFRTSLYFDSVTKTLDRIKSDRFVQFVSDLCGINRASGIWSFIEAAIENESIGPNSIPIEPEAFWAGRPNATYISNGPGRMVRITADAVEMVDNGTDGVLFPRGATLDPWELTDPVDPFETCELLRGLSASAGHGPLLAKLWALALPANPRNKPPLCLAGAIGSGKTRFAIGLCELFGLPIEGRIIKVEDNGERDFWPIMDAGGILILDNADTRTKWLPDALAAAATGGAQTKRKLYTDGEVIAMRPRAWLVITSAKPDSFAGDAGLADRLLIVRTERRSRDTRDAELSVEILANRNAGLSWICRMLQQALADRAEPPTTLNRRHPDFAKLAYRLGRAIGREADAVKALGAAEADKSLFCIESDSVGLAVLNFIRTNRSFAGSARELLESLTGDTFLESDPKFSAKSIGRRLEGIWPHLENVLCARREKDRTGTMRYQFSLREPEVEAP